MNGSAAASIRNFFNTPMKAAFIRHKRPILAILACLFIAGAITVLAIPTPAMPRQQSLTQEELDEIDENIIRGYVEERVTQEEAKEVAVDYLAMNAMQEILDERSRAPWSESQFIEAMLSPPQRECAEEALSQPDTPVRIGSKTLECIRRDLNLRDQASDWPDMSELRKQAVALQALRGLWEGISPATHIRARIIILSATDPMDDPAFLDFTMELEQEGCMAKTGQWARELAGLEQESRPPQEIWRLAAQEAQDCITEATQERFPPNPQAGGEEEAPTP